MKNAKRILCLILVLGVCFSLCGCRLLDALRASRATVLEDGTIRLYNGMEYKLLPQSQELNPTFSEFFEVYVAEEDLPLLLTVFAELSFHKSDDEKFLMTYTEDSEIYYCRTDIYDSVMDRLEKGFSVDACCYSCWDYDAGEEVIYTLTQAQWDLVEQIVATQEPEVIPEVAVMEWEHLADLQLCSEDQLFMRDTVDLCISKGKYYVADFGDVTTVYRVPEAMTAQIAEIMEKQIECDSYWDDWE